MKIINGAAAALDRAGEFPSSFPPFPRAALWFLAALLAAFLIFPEGWFYPQNAASLTSVSQRLAARVMPLVHGLSPLDVTSMPLLSVASLIAANGAPGDVQFLWLLMSLVICTCGYSLGCMLAGRAAGVAAAAALFAGQISPGLFFDIEQRFCCLMLLVAANALALTLFSAEARRAIEGCAIGAGFLSRSLLCWFPPLLAVLELACIKTAGTKKAAGRAAIVLVVPFLFLIPWIALGRGQNNAIHLFDGRTDWNMVTGALGKISTFEGDYRKLAGISVEENAVLWAARRILTHPAEYAAGVAGRVIFLLGPHAALLSLWLATALLLRGNHRFRRVNLMCAYLLALNLAFSSEERYLAGILPLLAASGAAGLFAFGGKGRGEPEEGFFFFTAGALLPAALALYCMFLLLSYPGPTPPHRKQALTERALDAHPGVSWLHREYGRLRLLAGDYSTAYAAFGKALILSPHDEHIRMDLAATALLKNRRGGRLAGGSGLIMKVPPDEGGWNSNEVGMTNLLRAVYELENGRQKQAADWIKRARAQRGKKIFFKLNQDAAEEKIFRDSDVSLMEWSLRGLMLLFPPDIQKSACPGIIGLYNAADRAAPSVPLSLCRNILAESLSLRESYSARPGPGRKPEEKPAWILAKGGDRVRILLDRCRELSRQKKKEQALQACQGAVHEAASGAGGASAALAELGSDASLESYKLFKALGRDDEAAETLFWGIRDAPASWRGLAEARSLLENPVAGQQSGN